jgi:polyribonucleotide nucleotidyltransferase
MHKIEFEISGSPMTIETGRLAKQAAGAVVVGYRGSAVLVTVNSSKPRPGIDFFPLTVDYVEKMSAAGKLPGGFFKREGRLTEKEILTSRFIDRALRPLFPDAYRDDTQVTATVLSAADDQDPDMLAFVGASAAVNLSDIPFPEPVGAVRVVRVNGEFLANPTYEQIDAADINVIVAGTRNALVMVEGGAKQCSEAEIIEALRFGHATIQPMLDGQADLVGRAGKPKKEVAAREIDEELRTQVEGMAKERIAAATRVTDKQARYAAYDEIKAEAVEKLSSEFRNRPLNITTLAEFEATQDASRKLVGDVKALIEEMKAQEVRRRILDGEARIDGRATTDIRPITCEVSLLPRVHGSGLFQRGETQALATVTLGGTDDEQLIDGLRPKHTRRFMLHYNFPPFSTGEVKPLRGPNRREIGHGSLAERAIRAVIPDPDDSPYTIRVVSEVLESNGSSSMATVCSSSLALMQAGIQIEAPVAGIAMGLISEDDRYAVLSDILGDEDHLGDMDFKVAGTPEGITAIQMDIKITGLDWEIMEKALEQAHAGRLHILECMAAETAESLPGFKPSEELSAHAPRVSVLWIKPDRIRDLIGPGGRVIRGIQETTGAKLDVDDSGRVFIFSPDVQALERCRAMVEELTQEAEVGRMYLGKVKKVTEFGAFVEIFPGTDGLLHISELADRRVAKVEDICVEGDEVLVKCIEVDPSGKIRLSRRQALEEGLEGGTEARAH